MNLKEQILPSMVMAPSAHNTQPWQFRVHDTSIDVYVDEQRHLTVSDPTQRELYLSLGCTLFNGIVAGAHAGFTADVVYFPEGEGRDAAVARLTLREGAANSKEASLFPAIKRRRTNRHVYDSKPLTSTERSALTGLQNAPAVFVDDKQRISELAKLTEEGTVATLSRPEFKEELSHWVRNNWTKQPDGMPGYAMGMPALLSLISSVMVRHAPIHKQEGPKTRRQMESVSAIAVLVGDDNPESWLKTGQLLEQLWLEATQAGLAVAPLAAGIEAHQDIRQKVQAVIKSDLLPQGILRIGHSKVKNLKMSPRRSVEDCFVD